MKNKKSKAIYFVYLITFRTYATWLHGDERLSVDPRNNVYGTPRIKSNPGLQQAMQKACKEDAFVLNGDHRNTVLQSLLKTCAYKHWRVYAAHIRTNHVHAVLQCDIAGKKAVSIIKAYATRVLKNNYSSLSQRKNFWSERSSARPIFGPEKLPFAMHYVIEEQGPKMALYHEKSWNKLDAVASLMPFDEA